MKKLLEIIGLVALMLVFFYAVFSTLHNLVKVVVLVGTLFASGAIIARLTKSSSYYGLVVVKGKYGFNLMKSIAKKHPKFVNELSDLGLSLGFGAFYSFYLFHKTPKKFLVHLLILVIVFGAASFSSVVPIDSLYLQLIGVAFGLAGIGFALIALNAFNILTVPGTPAGVNVVVPGVTVPWEAIFAIALIAIVHETAHGVMFCVEKLKVKNSGVLLAGFLPIGAFVEPDEKQFAKHRLDGRRRILVAGSASNFYSMIVLLPFLIIASIIASSFVSGILINSVAINSTANGVLFPGDVIVGVNNVSSTNSGQLIQELQRAGGPNASILLQLQDNRQIPVTMNNKGKLGIEISNNVAPQNSVFYTIAAFFASVLNWSVLLSLALSMINLLPLFITDGHHLVNGELSRLFPKNPKLAKGITTALALIILLLLLINAIPHFA
ncbi:MAG: site-2 protease family protein [Candidatus Micrarchaeota archaeon]